MQRNLWKSPALGKVSLGCWSTRCPLGRWPGHGQRAAGRALLGAGGSALLQRPLFSGAFPWARAKPCLQEKSPPNPAWELLLTAPEGRQGQSIPPRRGTRRARAARPPQLPSPCPVRRDLCSKESAGDPALPPPFTFPNKKQGIKNLFCQAINPSIKEKLRRQRAPGLILIVSPLLFRWDDGFRRGWLPMGRLLPQLTSLSC